jgi:hypothetical protein
LELRTLVGGVWGVGVRAELSQISERIWEGVMSWWVGKCGSVSFVGGVLGFEREMQEFWRQSKRTISLVGRGSAEENWRKRRSESDDVGFMVIFVGKNIPRVGW